MNTRLNNWFNTHKYTDSTDTHDNLFTANNELTHDYVYGRGYNSNVCNKSDGTGVHETPYNFIVSYQGDMFIDQSSLFTNTERKFSKEVWLCAD